MMLCFFFHVKATVPHTHSAGALIFMPRTPKIVGISTRRAEASGFFEMCVFMALYDCKLSH